jgi:hypothetical protein
VSVDSSASASGKKSISNDEDEKEETPAMSIDEQVLWEVDGVTVTATGISEDSFYGTEVDLLVENNSDKDIGIGTDAVIVNDYMIDDLTSVTVSAGKKANDSITLFSSELEAAGIENIGKIEVYFHTFDPDTYMSDKESGCITINTSNADNYDTETSIEGTTLYEKDGIKIVGQYVDESSFWGTAVMLYIENNSDKNIIVQCDDVSVNGYMVDALQSQTVYAGKKAIDDITLFQSDLDENGITSVDEVETEFKILDENFMDIDNSGKVSFSTK